jgi:tripartite-type tricarboxylate transporter receptor subunit TctC
MWDGNCQAAYGATNVFEECTLDGVDAQQKLKIIGLMSPDRLPDKDWPTFAEQGITLDGKPFDFTKEYSLFYPKDIPEEYVAALRDVCASPTYLADMEKVGYMPQFFDSKENTKHTYEKREAFRKFIENAPNFDDLTE